MKPTLLATNLLLLFFTFKSFSQESKVSVKRIINDATELSKFPDSSYFLLKENFQSVNDSVFIKKVFFPNKGLYNENKDKINEDFSLSGMAEYNVLPREVYKKNKTSVKILGKLTKTNYTSLIIRYYDINSVRYYLMNFDKNQNAIASICFFAYSTIDPEDVYQSTDKLYFLPFIHYKQQVNTFKVYSKGFLDINYVFKIQNDGTINLTKKEKLDKE